MLLNMDERLDKGQLVSDLMSPGRVISQLQSEEFESNDLETEDPVPSEDTHAEREMAEARLDPLPKPLRVQLTTASDCRELLRQLTSLSYKVTDVQILRDLSQTLHSSIATLSSHCDCGEDGLHKEPGTKTATQPEDSHHSK